MSVADVYKSQRLGPMTVSGRIQTGTLVVGDQVRVMPVYELCTVKAMSDHRGMPCKCAIAGTNVEIGLVGLDRYVLVLIGYLYHKKMYVHVKSYIYIYISLFLYFHGFFFLSFFVLSLFSIFFIFFFLQTTQLYNFTVIRCLMLVLYYVIH